MFEYQTVRPGMDLNPGWQGLDRFSTEKARPRIGIDIGLRRTHLPYKLDSLIPVRTIAGGTLIRPEGQLLWNAPPFPPPGFGGGGTDRGTDTGTGIGLRPDPEI